MARELSGPVMKHFFPLRPDLNVTLWLPEDLTADDAVRLSRFIDSLAAPLFPGDEGGGDYCACDGVNVCGDHDGRPGRPRPPAPPVSTEDGT